MLPSANRLRSEKDFSRLFRKGFGVSGRNLTLKKVSNNRTDSRIGFVISNKISKKASVRNLLKRRMRYAVRQHLNGLMPGFDAAFIAKPSIKDLTYEQLRQEMTMLLNKAGLIKVV